MGRASPRSIARSRRPPRPASSSGEIVVSTIDSKVCRTGSFRKLVERHVTDQELDQRLGDRAIGIVHAHVIAIIGRPAQGQLGEVAGADDEPLRHEQERAQPGLDVFEGEVAAGLAGHASQRGAKRMRRPGRGSRSRRVRGRSPEMSGGPAR